MFILDRITMFIVLLFIVFLIVFCFGVDWVAMFVVLFLVVFLTPNGFVVLLIVMFLILDLLFVVLNLIFGWSCLC